MQIQRLQELISNPALVRSEDRDGLKEWSVKYPYAGVIRVLLAKASAVSGHMDQEEDLLRAAAAAPFRQPLFDLLLRSKLIEEAKAIDESFERKLPSEVKDSSEMEVLETEDGDSMHQSPPLDPEIPAEREALISAIERTIEQEVDSWSSEDKKSKFEVDETRRAADFELLHQSVASPFATWLLRRAGEIGFGTAPRITAVPKSSPEALIDAFIVNAPKMGPLRDVDASVEEWAKSSVMEDPTLVTETMARIYVKQGQLGKARKAYRMLALKYPAKSTYFATQLKKLNGPNKSSDEINE